MKLSVTFSVIVPLYNKEAHIERTLDSVFAQSFQDFEVIVVDDGSTDGGAGIVERMAVSDKRTKLVRQKNRGVSFARNAAIAIAHGKYLVFLDADDFWEPAHLENILAVAERYPQAALIGTAFQRIFPEGPAVSIVVEKFKNGFGLIDDYFKLVGECQFIYTSSIAVASWALDNEPAFEEGVSHGEDIDLWTRIALRWPVAYCGKVTVNYTCGIYGQATNHETASLSRHRLYLPKSLERHFTNNRLPENVRKELKAYAGKIVVRSSRLFFRHRNLEKKKWREFLAKFNDGAWHGCRELSIMKQLDFALFWQIYYFLRSMFHSRRFLALCGGRFSRKGIQYRLNSSR